MIINLDITNSKTSLVVIGIKRKKIVYNSGVQSFSNYDLAKRFKDKLIKNLKRNNPEWKYEFYIVSTKEPIKPLGDKHIKRGEVYCPYCAQTVTLKYHKSLGYKRCPICNISEVEYFMKYYNKGNLGSSLKKKKNKRGKL